MESKIIFYCLLKAFLTEGHSNFHTRSLYFQCLLQGLTQMVKNLPEMRETWVRFLGWEDPLEKGKATHSSILAWRIPWRILYFPWGRKKFPMASSSGLISFLEQLRDQSSDKVLETLSPLWLDLAFIIFDAQTQIKERKSESCSVVSNSLWPHGL